MAEIVREQGEWWARNEDGKIEIAYCPYCGRELPGDLPDPNQLRLELVE